MKNAFAHNAFAASGGISQTAADARYARLASANTFSAAQTFSVNGAASTPALSLTGTILTGQTSTTNKPHLLIEPAGTTSTGWSTAGTGLGINLASGIGLDIQSSGVSKFKVNSTGVVTAVWGTIDTNGNCTINGSNAYIRSGGRGPALGVSAYATSMSDAGPTLASTASILFTAGASYNGTIDAGLSRISSALLKITDGSTGYGTLDAAGFKVGGVAGAAGGTFTTITSITVSNGIITAISGS